MNGRPSPVTVQAPKSFLHIDWNREFSERRDLDYDAENKPLLEVIAETGSELEAENKFLLEVITANEPEHEVEYKSLLEGAVATGPEHEIGTLTESENAIRDFMRGPDDSDICTPEADTVLAFCSKSSLQHLLRKTGPPLPQVAWLDERNFLDGKVQARAQEGPLTALSLYKQLKKPVSNCLNYD